MSKLKKLTNSRENGVRHHFWQARCTSWHVDGLKSNRNPSNSFVWTSHRNWDCTLRCRQQFFEQLRAVKSWTNARLPKILRMLWSTWTKKLWGKQRAVWDETGLKDSRTQLGILETFQEVWNLIEFVLTWSYNAHWFTPCCKNFSLKSIVKSNNQKSIFLGKKHLSR